MGCPRVLDDHVAGEVSHPIVKSGVLLMMRPLYHLHPHVPKHAAGSPHAKRPSLFSKSVRANDGLISVGWLLPSLDRRWGLAITVVGLSLAPLVLPSLDRRWGLAIIVVGPSVGCLVSRSQPSDGPTMVIREVLPTVYRR